MSETAAASPERQEIGNRLRTARTTLRLSQQAVADKIGIPRAAVSDIEAGRRNVTVVELRHLAALYRLSTQQILGETVLAPVDEALQCTIGGLADSDKQLVLRFARFLAIESAP